MKKRILCAGLFAAMVMLAACGEKQGAGERSITGASLAELRGQWVVINYWAKWCKPCIKEIPELNELDRRYPQVTVVGVNYDGATGEELATQLKTLGVEFASLPRDPASELSLPRPQVLPTTIILTPSGEISQILVGPQTMASLALATHQSTTE